jgi:hypothetical protein
MSEDKELTRIEEMESLAEGHPDEKTIRALIKLLRRNLKLQQELQAENLEIEQELVAIISTGERHEQIP